MENKKFYITTAIAYASSKPHIGNAYDIVLADMIARYKRLMGFDVYFMTGSDEHGQKLKKRQRKKVFLRNSMLIMRLTKLKQFGTALTQPTINLFAQPMPTTKKLFLKYLRNFTNKAIFTKANMKENTVFLVNRSLPLRSL